MIFTRTKQIMFTNNKGGVGKTTTAFNIAAMFAKHGYKTVLIDLDSQCNLSRLALGEDFFEHAGYKEKDIYKVLEGVIKGGSDVGYDIPFSPVSENLYILPGNIKLSAFENILSSAFNEAGSGLERGFFTISAIDRFLRRKGLYEEIDLFIIDSNPSLSQLNKAIFLGADHFIVPINPDAFNHQGIENLGNFLEEEKRNRHTTSKVLARDKNIPSSQLLNGEAIFLGYLINSYNVYNKKPIYSQKKWIELLPEQIKVNLSHKLSKNGLVDISYQQPLGSIQDYGQLATLGKEEKKAIFDITEAEAKFVGTIENLHKAQEEFGVLYEEIRERLESWKNDILFIYLETIMINQVIRYSPLINMINNEKVKKHNLSILEIGSGSQGLGKFYNHAFDGVDETTADYGNQEKITSKNMNFIQGNACKLPFDDNSYDFVFSLDMIEHIPNHLKEKAFEEAIRVSKGKVIMAFPCGIYAKSFDYGFFNFLKGLRFGKKPGGWLEEHYDIGLPSEKTIEHILCNLKLKYNFTRKQFGNGNICMRACIIIGENILQLIGKSNLIESIAQKINTWGYNFSSIIPYRRFYIIQKKHG